MISKQTAIYFLVSIAALLLVTNIFIEVTQQKPIPKNVEISKFGIEGLFSEVLEDFSIKNEWVKKVFVKHKLSDSLNYIFRVKIPIDIPIPELIKELNERLPDKNVSLVCNEKKIYGDTVVRVFANGMLKLEVSLKLSKKIFREHAEYGFLVIPDESSDEIDEVLSKIYHPFVLLISPSKENLNLIKRVERDYSILLNDELYDGSYSLEDSFSKQKLIYQIRSILIDFGKNRKYFIDETSELYNSKIFSFVRDEFKKRGVNLIYLQNFMLLKGNTKRELVSLFNFYTTSLTGKEGKIFLIKLSDLLQLQNEIALRAKKGDRVFSKK